MFLTVTNFAEKLFPTFCEQGAHRFLTLLIPIIKESKLPPPRSSMRDAHGRFRVRGPCRHIGPDRMVCWVGTYLIPTVVIVGELIGTFVLFVREGGKATEKSTTRSTNVPRLTFENSYSTYAHCRIPGKPEKPPRQCIPSWGWPRPCGC